MISGRRCGARRRLTTATSHSASSVRTGNARATQSSTAPAASNANSRRSATQSHSTKSNNQNQPPEPRHNSSRSPVRAIATPQPLPKRPRNSGDSQVSLRPSGKRSERLRWRLVGHETKSAAMLAGGVRGRARHRLADIGSVGDSISLGKFRGHDAATCVRLCWSRVAQASSSTSYSTLQVIGANAVWVSNRGASSSVNACRFTPAPRQGERPNRRRRRRDP